MQLDAITKYIVNNFSGVIPKFSGGGKPLYFTIQKKRCCMGLVRRLLRTLRIFRLLRLFRILKLGRYNRAINRFNSAISESKEELVVFLFATIITLYLAAVGIYYFEHDVQPQSFKSLFDCLWWSITTLTTVGYGDIYPVTLGGRLFTFIILMLGLGLVVVPTGIVATSLSAIRKRQEAGD